MGLPAPPVLSVGVLSRLQDKEWDPKIKECVDDHPDPLPL
jgi:hypothetical protein